MDAEKVNMYIVTNEKYFPQGNIPFLRQKLMELGEDKMNYLYAVDLKDPTIYLLISIFVGSWGVDRFMMGDVGMGVLKLLTGGLCGILWVYDMVTIMGSVKEQNYTQVMNLIMTGQPYGY